MPVVTMAGRIGSPARLIGVETARLLGADYVDHQIIVEASRRIGAPLEEVVQKDERSVRGRERLADFFQKFLERSAAAGSGGDPFLGPTGIEVLMSRSMAEAAEPPGTQTDKVNDERYITAITSVIVDESKTGNVVLIGRAGNVILNDLPTALHVWVVAFEESRIQEIARRENLSEQEAKKFIKYHEEGRAAYYRKFHKVEPDDPTLYHLVLNTNKLGTEHSAQIIADAARAMDRVPTGA